MHRERDIPRWAEYVRLHRDRLEVRFLAKLAKATIRAYENQSHDLRTNGEMLVLQRFGALRAQTIFDVGANVGQWARLATRLVPDAQVHCFEIVPETSEMLRNECRPYSNIVINSIGLSDRNGTVETKVYPSHLEWSSTVDYPRSTPYRVETCPVITGDEYVRVNRVKQIDLLKIDAEGAEWDILRGFQNTFAAGRIRAVQFEYGFANVLTHRLLIDFYRFFSDKCYRVGKVYPRHVQFRSYELEHENFLGPNYLAVAGNEEVLLTILSSQP